MHRKLKSGPKEEKRSDYVYLQINTQVAFNINLRSGARLNVMHDIHFNWQFLGFLEISLLSKDLELRKFYC